MPQNGQHDAHALPPDGLRALFKKCQRSTVQEIVGSPDVLDLHRSEDLCRVTKFESFSGRGKDIQHAIREFLAEDRPTTIRPRRIAEPVLLDAFSVNNLPGALWLETTLEEVV